jgi:hypothetical protein
MGYVAGLVYQPLLPMGAVQACSTACTLSPSHCSICRRGCAGLLRRLRLIPIPLLNLPQHALESPPRLPSTHSPLRPFTFPAIFKTGSPLPALAIGTEGGAAGMLAGPDMLEQLPGLAGSLSLVEAALAQGALLPQLLLYRDIMPPPSAGLTLGLLGATAPGQAGGSAPAGTGSAPPGEPRPPRGLMRTVGGSTSGTTGTSAATSLSQQASLAQEGSLASATGFGELSRRGSLMQAGGGGVGFAGELLSESSHSSMMGGLGAGTSLSNRSSMHSMRSLVRSHAGG